MPRFFLSKMLVFLVLLSFSMEIHTAPLILSMFKQQQQQQQQQQGSTRPPVTMSTPATPYTIINNGQGAVYEWQNDVITVRLNGTQTQGLFTLTEDAMKPTFKLGLHLHRKHAETFHVLEGEVEFRLGSRIHVARAGTTVHAPPNVPHGVRGVNGKPARMLMLYSPAGIENFFKDMKTFTDAQFADQKFMNAFNEKYDNIELE